VFHYTLTATGNGHIYHLNDIVILPPGLTFLDDTVYFHSTSQNLAPIISGDTLAWHFDSIPWIRDSLHAASIMLTIRAVVGCDYDETPPVISSTDATSYCGLQIHDNLTPSPRPLLGDHCNPHCLFADIGPRDTTLCIGDTLILHANASGGHPPYTYLWLPDSVTTDSIVIVASTTQGYSLTLTDSIGQTYYDEIRVNVSECLCTRADIIIPDSTYSHTLGAGYSNHSVIITGTFFIDSAFYFDTCSVRMWSDARIMVLNTNQLTIDSSYVFACDSMWDAIILQDSGSSLTINTSIIEDAIKAIYSVNTFPSITIDSSLFDHNYVSINLINEDVTSTCSITNSTFQCSGGLSKYPYAGDNAFAHISLENTIMKVGDEAADDFNYFNDADYGILGSESEVTAYHNSFTNLGNFRMDDSNGGIFMYYRRNRPSILAAGNEFTEPPGITYRNEFKDCYRGITTKDDVILSVYKNFIEDCRTGILVLGNLPLNGNSPPVDIRANFVVNCNDGILLTDISKIKLNVDSNTIYSPYTDDGFPNGRHGIAVFNSYPLTDSIHINNNEVYDYHYGIKLLNADSMNYFDIGYNSITFTFDSAHSDGSWFRGLTMTDCAHANVYDNVVTWNSSPALSDAASINSFADVVQGMRIEAVERSQFTCNTITTCGTGMFLQNGCGGTQLYHNTLYDNFPGMGFDNITLPNQGDTLDPAGNVWDGSFGYTSAFGKCDGNGSLFRYYYSGAANDTTNSLYPLPPSLPFLIFPLHTSVGTFNCNSTDGPEGGNSIMNEELQSIVDVPTLADENSDFANEDKYNRQAYAYDVMLNVPELINTSARDSFMTVTEQNNIGLLSTVESSLLEGDSIQANSINSSIIDTNQIEENKKTINDIYLNSADSLTTADSITLNQIAHQLAMQGGQAVYWARGKLRLDIEDNYSSNSRPSTHFIDFGKHVLVYPNPSNENINFKCDIGNILFVQIENILGEQVLNNVIKNNQGAADITSLPNGTYILKFFLQNKEEIKKKLTIIH
jgi:hypothetical protein